MLSRRENHVKIDLGTQNNQSLVLFHRAVPEIQLSELVPSHFKDESSKQKVYQSELQLQELSNITLTMHSSNGMKIMYFSLILFLIFKHTSKQSSFSTVFFSL